MHLIHGALVKIIEEAYREPGTREMQEWSGNDSSCY